MKKNEDNLSNLLKFKCDSACSCTDISCSAGCGSSSGWCTLNARCQIETDVICFIFVYFLNNFLRLNFERINKQ